MTVLSSADNMDTTVSRLMRWPQHGCSPADGPDMINRPSNQAWLELSCRLRRFLAPGRGRL